MATKKHSVGLEYVDFNEDIFKKFELELAIPLSGEHGSPGFFKAEAFMAKTVPLKAKKLDLSI
jgi:hypothetical protein